MSLIQLLEDSPNTIWKLDINQIVNLADKGELFDGNECSRQLRHYLTEAPFHKLSEYSKYCITKQKKKFEKSGQVLQDIINEIGRRMEYHVENGLYQGVKNKNGYDGLWRDLNGHSLIIEVKTTDVYTTLDSPVKYRNKLIQEGRINAEHSSILFVVGREDIGGLESQIRGSRHAWDIRVISIEALIDLAELKINSAEREITKKIQSLLIPFEYTRLDKIIDIIFTTTKDVESSVEAEESGPQKKLKNQIPNNSSKEILDKARTALLNSIGKKEKVSLIAYKRAQFGSSDKSVRVACSVSKQYEGQGYWYIYHPRWNQFLREVKKGFFALCCVDQEFGYVIPNDIIVSLLPKMNQTVYKNNNAVWHVHLKPNKIGKGFGMVLKKGEFFDLEKYKINLIQ